MLSAAVGRFATRASISLRRYASGSKYVYDVTDATFQKEVVEASHKTPVVLDCWAEYVSPPQS